MSGRDVVRALRENTDLNKPPRQGISIDMLLGFVALAAVICCVGVAVDMFFLRGAPPPAQIASAAAPASDAVWEETDDATCQRWIAQARADDNPDAFSLADPAITGGGYAALAANLDCHASVKVTRLCDPEQKAALVALLNDYLSRRDLISLGLDAQGAPMKVMGSMMGGEAAFGSSVYDITKENTLAYMDAHHQRVVKAIRALAVGGILSTNDFSFMGYGVPVSIKEMIGGVAASQPICG